jgi:hypothetical protein
MARNSHKLQRQAARLLVAGMSGPDIVRKLGIRTTTFERWQHSDIFKRVLIQARISIEHEIDLSMLRLCRDYLDATSDMVSLESKLHCMDERTMFHAVRLINVIGKERIFSSFEPKDKPKRVPNKPQTSTKQAQTSTESTQKSTELAQISTESTLLSRPPENPG